jgi:hypothetical protein
MSKRKKPDGKVLPWEKATCVPRFGEYQLPAIGVLVAETDEAAALNLQISEWLSRNSGSK